MFPRKRLKRLDVATPDPSQSVSMLSSHPATPFESVVLSAAQTKLCSDSAESNINSDRESSRPNVQALVRLAFNPNVFASNFTEHLPGVNFLSFCMWAVDLTW
jgi:hypothetical protein